MTDMMYSEKLGLKRLRWATNNHVSCRITGVFVGLARQQNAEELSAAAGLPPRAPPGEESSPSGDPMEQWRRRVYPAGRIMHLVPLHLIPGASASLMHSSCCQLT